MYDGLFFCTKSTKQIISDTIIPKTLGSRDKTLKSLILKFDASGKMISFQIPLVLWSPGPYFYHIVQEAQPSIHSVSVKVSPWQLPHT